MDFFDYGQFVSFENPRTAFHDLPSLRQYALTPSLCPPQQDYVCPMHPCGSILKILILSTWGDVHFVGLERIQLFSPDGERIAIDPEQVFAQPASVNDIKEEKSQWDPRTVDKLFRYPDNAGFSSKNCWLAPLRYRGHASERGEILNCIYVVTQVPIFIGCVKVGVGRGRDD